jgi:hypothetical protein
MSIVLFAASVHTLYYAVTTWGQLVAVHTVALIVYTSHSIYTSSVAALTINAAHQYVQASLLLKSQPHYCSCYISSLCASAATTSDYTSTSYTAAACATITACHSVVLNYLYY